MVYWSKWKEAGLLYQLLFCCDKIQRPKKSTEGWVYLALRFQRDECLSWLAEAAASCRDRVRNTRGHIFDCKDKGKEHELDVKCPMTSKSQPPVTYFLHVRDLLINIPKQLGTRCSKTWACEGHSPSHHQNHTSRVGPKTLEKPVDPYKCTCLNVPSPCSLDSVIFSA